MSGCGFITMQKGVYSNVIDWDEDNPPSVGKYHIEHQLIKTLQTQYVYLRRKGL